jgi:hypothetical protein
VSDKQEAGPPPIADQNANSSGTEVTGYLTEGESFSAFVLDDGTVYQTYLTGARGVEFLWATTGSSTARRRAATRATGPNSGSGDTTSTTKADESGRPRPVRAAGRSATRRRWSCRR